MRECHFRKYSFLLTVSWNIEYICKWTYTVHVFKLKFLFLFCCSSILHLVVTNKGNHLLITLCLVCSTIMVKCYEKLWLLKKITNYWHLNFLLLIAPKRGWHLCSINTGPYGENTEIYSSLKLLHWLNLNCASIIGRSFTNFVFFMLIVIPRWLPLQDIVFT